MFIVYSILEASAISCSLVWWLILSVKIKFPIFLSTVLWRKSGHVGKAWHVHGQLPCCSHFTLREISPRTHWIQRCVGQIWYDMTNKENVDLRWHLILCTEHNSLNKLAEAVVLHLCFGGVKFASQLQYQLSWLMIFCLSLVLPGKWPQIRPWVLPSTSFNSFTTNYTSFDAA